MPIMTAVECSSRLVSICEHGPGSVKMPYTIQLVKQLKKELNVQKIMKDYKKVGRGVGEYIRWLGPGYWQESWCVGYSEG